MALGRLFSALPVRHGDAADQVEVYLMALEDVSHYALDAVVKMAISGRHPKLSKKFAPTTAELGEAIHDEMEQLDRLIEVQAERLRLADQRLIPVRRKQFDERASELRSRMAAENRRVAISCSSHDDFLRKRHAVGEIIRGGGVYHAILGEAYGPPGWVPPAPAEAPAPAPRLEPEPPGVAW